MDKRLEYIEKYRRLHSGIDSHIEVLNGKEIITKNEKQTMFSGNNFTVFRSLIKKFSEQKGKAITILDYGCGQAHHLFRTINNTENFYSYMEGNIQCYWCYDPAVERFSKKPPFVEFDVVACCDVLEHIPEEFIDDTLDDIVQYTGKDTMVVFSISGRLAKKSFIDGENLHCTIKSLNLWKEKLFNRFPSCYIKYTDMENKQYNVTNVS